MTEEQNDSSLTSAMTDLMTSLAVIFILLLVVYLNHSYQETQKSSMKVKDKLIEKFIALGIKAENDPRDPLALIIRLHDDKLQFDHNKAVLKPKGQQYLKGFIPKLTSTICAKDTNKDIESLLIQGFTDSDGNDEHNLELSQDRAFQVSKFTIDKAGLNWQTRECFLNLTSTNGRGKRELLPTGSKPGKENKSASRRVEFKIRVKSFEQKKKIENTLEKSAKISTTKFN